jgi:hypothetical protein
MQSGSAPPAGDSAMGMWIELFVFGLVFLFAWHQFRDLKREKKKREEQQAASRSRDDQDAA